jgi:AraC-like DNA-binding protein
VFASIGTYIDQTTETNRHLIDQVHIQQPGFRENSLLQLLHGDISDQEFLKRTEPCDFPFDQPWHCICVAEIDDFIGFQHKYGIGDRALMMYAWPKMMREVCEERYACMTVGSRPGQITLIIGMRAADSETELHIRMLCDRIRERIRQYLKFTVSIAIGKPSSSLNTISKEFDEALRTLHYRYWLGKDATITRADLLASDSFRETSRLIVRYEKVTVNAIAQGDFEQAEQAVKELFGSIPITGPPSAIGYFSHLIGAIDHMMEEMNGVNPVFDYNLYEKWNTFETVSEAASWFHTEYFPRLRSHFGEQTIWQRKQTVQQVIHFIHEQFETDVSLQQLADRFGLPTYQLSRMFKEETGRSFLDYLIECRITKAKEWLVHSDMPIKEMTERLCYATTQNFTRVFKQMTGVPPGKYRDDYRRSRDGGKSGPI